MQENLGKIHDVREELRRSPTAIASLTVLAAGRRIGAHVHANPYLALHVLGSYRDHAERGDVRIDGPAAIFFPAGSTHAMTIGNAGLATVIVEFDRDALQRAVHRTVGLKNPYYWLGGEVGRRAHRLAHRWLSGGPKQQLLRTVEFLDSALATAPHCSAPLWLDQLETLVDDEFLAPDVERWAKRFGVTRSWLVRAYRHWRGEGLGETLRRRRVELAAIMLESSDMQLAEIAIEAGFCDQSHMNRAFRKYVARTPAAARAARLGLAGEYSSMNAPRRTRLTRSTFRPSKPSGFETAQLLVLTSGSGPRPR